MYTSELPVRHVVTTDAALLVPSIKEGKEKKEDRQPEAPSGVVLLPKESQRNRCLPFLWFLFITYRSEGCGWPPARAFGSPFAIRAQDLGFQAPLGGGGGKSRTIWSGRKSHRAS